MASASTDNVGDACAAGAAVAGNGVQVDWPALNKKLVDAAKTGGGIPVVADVTASSAVQELITTCSVLNVLCEHFFLSFDKFQCFFLRLSNAH